MSSDSNFCRSLLICVFWSVWVVSCKSNDPESNEPESSDPESSDPDPTEPLSDEI